MEEKHIADWALHMSRIGYGRMWQKITGIIKKILDEDYWVNTFVNNKPGRHWLHGFFKWHPLCTTVQLGKERAIINKSKILQWFVDVDS